MNIFTILYDFLTGLSTICEVIWTWLNTQYTILGITFTPLFITGAAIIAFMVARLIKEFVPLS